MTGKVPKKPPQIEAFREAARKLRASDSEDQFDDALRTVGRQKPKPTADVPPPKKLFRLGLRDLIEGPLKILRLFGRLDLPRRIDEALGFFGVVGLGYLTRLVWHGGLIALVLGLSGSR